MVLHYSKCHFIPPYYGCYCGMNLSSDMSRPPVDNYDAACQKHDQCYIKADHMGCSHYYITSYNYWMGSDSKVSWNGKEMRNLVLKSGNFLIFCLYILLTHEGSHREVYQEFQPSCDIF